MFAGQGTLSHLVGELGSSKDALGEGRQRNQDVGVQRRRQLGQCRGFWCETSRNGKTGKDPRSKRGTRMSGK